MVGDDWWYSKGQGNMKLFGVVLLAMFTALGQSQGSALEEKVRALFLLREGITFTELRLKLLQLGGENEVAAVLTQFANTYKHAAERSLEFLVLDSSPTRRTQRSTRSKISSAALSTFTGTGRLRFPISTRWPSARIFWTATSATMSLLELPEK